MTDGRKDDGGKIRMELIPPELLTAVGSILTFGAVKYAPRNWELGMDWSRVYGALLRHLNAWWAGEQTDPETGKSHLWHAGACISFLIAFEQRGSGNDDRP
ncbi:dATP/dGTP diphosphohydrolase domain-containing protein [Limimaricola cinnabarinus]|uniref:dATP/dGTP diphosphohydrolase domain-containing protein n=1 Tax=Limimaricola cinnabarinus TaxID=1125964 RepID=UPI00249372A0|nr:dATP/dGTP diphosphohydrolase domain-containing protein [Limimaricola cinnabarinus]